MTPIEFYRLPVEIAFREDLTPAAKLVYGILLTREGNNGDSWPGLGSLARDAGISRSAVQVSIHHLTSLGLIISTRRAPGLSNLYKTTGPKTGIPENTIPESSIPENEPGVYQNLGGGIVKSGNKKKREKKIEKKNKGAVEIPAKLEAIPGFAEAWTGWIKYRQQIGKKISDMTAVAQLKKLAGMENPIGVIDQSITAGWQGFFELKGVINDPSKRNVGRSFESAKGQPGKFANVGTVIRV